MSNLGTKFPKDASLKWVHPAHALSNPNVVIKEQFLDPDSDYANTFFQTANNTVTFDIPKDLDEIVDMHIIAPITNGDASDTFTFGAPPQFMFDKWELLKGSDVVKTYKPLHAYLDDNLYYTSAEREHVEYESRIDKSTRAMFSSANTIAATASSDVYIHVPNIFTQCMISPKQLKSQYRLRFYSSASYALAASAAAVTDLTLGTLRMRVRHRVGHADKLAIQSRSDYRFLDTVATDISESLTSGTEKSIITKHFSDTDLYSHFMVLIRASGAANEGLINFLPLTSIAIEDEAGNNLTNGQTYTSDQLLKNLYPQHFKNTMSIQSNRAVYVPLVASTDVVSDARKGTCSGALNLRSNMRLRIVPAATATRQIHMIAKKYAHVSIVGGDFVFH